jgi:hypothetical protein
MICVKMRKTILRLIFFITLMGSWLLTVSIPAMQLASMYSLIFMLLPAPRALRLITSPQHDNSNKKQMSSTSILNGFPSSLKLLEKFLFSAH